MKSMNRRTFLRGAAGLAGAGFGVAALGSRLEAAKKTKPAKARVEKVSPNEQIRVAVIGVRGRGREHIRAWGGLKETVVPVLCDIDAREAAKAIQAVESRQEKTPAFLQDLRRVLDDKTIDAVSIATPNHWHALAAIWAMQAGKDVYVEKPVSHNVSEGRRMVEAARRYGKICQTGTQCRSHDAVRQAIEYLHGGGLGKLRLARGLCYKRRPSIGHKSDSRVPPGVDFNLWLGPAPLQAFNENRFHYNWHWQWDTGNGDLGNQGIHQMDLARWGLNKSTLPAKVLGLGGRFGYTDDGQMPNTELTVFDYGDSQLIFEVRGLPTPALLGATVGNVFYGSEGTLVVQGYTHAAVLDPKGEVVKTFDGGGDHFANFVKAVKSRRPSDLNAPILEGHLSSALCHLGNISYRLGSEQPFSAKTQSFGADREASESFARMEEHLKDDHVPLDRLSYRLGRTLAFDPERERFASDPEANEMLTRTYRAPFVVPERV